MANCNPLKKKQTESPKILEKRGPYERRRSYLRGFPKVNCNHFKTKKIANFDPF